MMNRVELWDAIASHANSSPPTIPTIASHANPPLATRRGNCMSPCGSSLSECSNLSSRGGSGASSQCSGIAPHVRPRNAPLGIPEQPNAPLVGNTLGISMEDALMLSANRVIRRTDSGGLQPDDRRRGRRGGRGDVSLEQAEQLVETFKLDIGRVLSGEDQRATVMMRNIPNKYNQRMLLTAIEECSAGAIDLFYLPIDFKSHCNNGYCFINFTHPAYIPVFYNEFDGKKWDRYNSEKVAEVTYARIQGKEELIKHFSNSSLCHEDESMQPVVWASCNGTSVRETIPWHLVRSKPTRDRRRDRGRSNREAQDSGSTSCCSGTSSGYSGCGASPYRMRSGFDTPTDASSSSYGSSVSKGSQLMHPVNFASQFSTASQLPPPASSAFEQRSVQQQFTHPQPPAFQQPPQQQQLAQPQQPPSHQQLFASQQPVAVQSAEQATAEAAWQAAFQQPVAAQSVDSRMQLSVAPNLPPANLPYPASDFDTAPPPTALPPSALSTPSPRFVYSSTASVHDEGMPRGTPQGMADQGINEMIAHTASLTASITGPAPTADCGAGHPTMGLHLRSPEGYPVRPPGL